MKRFLKLGVAVFLLSITLNACGKKLTPVVPLPSPSEQPVSNIPDDFHNYPDNNNGINNNFPSVPTAVPNTQAGTFKVDQDLMHSWQAKGIAVSGGTIYVSASDTSGLSKKGTIIKMNSSDGKNWKDLTSSMFGVRHPIDSTVTGLAISGGTIIAGDSSSKIYVVDATKGSVKKVNNAGGLDIAASAGSFFIANGTIERTDASANSRNPIPNVSVTGGIGSDSMGNAYAVSGNTIKKVDVNGQVTDIITTDLVSPIDVAVDNRNGDIYVLEQAMIKRFTSNGQLLSQFSNGATKPVGIAIDETGCVYVADNGTSKADSKIVKFSASIDGNSSTINNFGYQNSYSNLGAGYNNMSYYSSYSNTRTSTKNSRLAGRQ
jgi:hypothetical protein